MLLLQLVQCLCDVLFRVDYPVPALLLHGGLLPDDVGFFLRKHGGLFVRHVLASVVLDLEHEIYLLEGQILGLHIEVPDYREPCEVQYSEYDVEFPGNVGDSYFTSAKHSSAQLRQQAD